jgi:hypothetical protein
MCASPSYATKGTTPLTAVMVFWQKIRRSTKGGFGEQRGSEGFLSTL